jgi:DNA-binding transcriptional LysR family regulator
MRFNNLDLNQLVVLDALLATRSVTLTAERVFLSQPATSCALARLRTYFDDDLIIQSGAERHLTPLAELLAQPVRDVLLQIKTITVTRPAFDPATSTRRFVIEASDYVISVFLAEVTRRAAELAPAMQFDLRAISPRSREHLQNGDIEILIVPESASAPDHACERLFEDTLSCIVWSEGPLGKEKLTAGKYFQASHVGVEWEGGRRITSDARVLAAGNQRRKQDLIAPTFSLVPDLVVGSKRIATLPTRLARLMATRFPLTVKPCPVPFPAFAETMQWRRHLGGDPAIAWLRSILREMAGHMSG